MAIGIKDIGSILDITWKVNAAGKRTIPCISGPAGVGKSQGVHQWVDKMAKTIPGFRMIDLRGATIDSSDTRGLPWKDEKTGKTVYLPPDFLPTDGFGVLFIDEINRSPTPVMNCFMELFTEKRIGNYKLPNDPKNGMWIIVTAINPPDSEAYDVNTMDAALLNRVMMYDVKFDHKSFIAYAKAKSWSDTVIAYLASGEWIYKEPGTGDGHYISPRTWEEMSDLELAGAKENQELHSDICTAALGKNIGKSYWAFCHQEKPITYDDIDKEYGKVGRKKDKLVELPSMKEFAKHTDQKRSGGIRADLIGTTRQSILNKIAAKGVDSLDHDIIEGIAMMLPADQAVAMVQEIAMKTTDPARFVQDFKAKRPAMFERLKTSIKQGNKAVGQ